jgi:uncharacterized protein involved in response to NO
MMAGMSNPWRWWIMRLSEEPYRVFFPLGVLAGMWGVLMWPLSLAGWLKHYPGYPLDAHARIMSEGFMGAFVVGFLGTAFPRLTGNRPLRVGELVVLVGLWLATAGSLGLGRIEAGDAAFAALMAATLAILLSRWIFGHRDTPPPGFILALLGLAGSGVAAGLLSRGGGWGMGVHGVQGARLFLYQGFVLLPLLGIGPYLLPRFFGQPSRHSFDDSPQPPAGWWRRCISSLVVGGVVLASIAIEVAGHPFAGQFTRAVAVAGWFVLETPVFRRPHQPTTLATAVRWALVSIIAGLAAAAAWPQARVGSLHLAFVSGIGLVTLAVATRVTLGHAGRHDLSGGRIVWLRWLIGLAMLAATTRMSADFLPQIRSSHLVYAAWTWVAASILWLWFAGRFLAHSDEPRPRGGRCPGRGTPV